MERCWGSGSGASVGRRQWHIVVGGVSAAWDEGVSRHEVPADARRSCQQKKQQSTGIGERKTMGTMG
jgi:hypothetical protein